ncbi:TetR/AcrR family transcriptional regulator [Demequina sp. NBRC 110051]|uniref:TetR/AcrR family transcriptional regulator n=1 Tax=Demequina sp. NBRC 110051 TaxID=1570340 RepID=UPI000A07B2E2|nr:TetR family transcriptional regulator [Demequina sp. NBRC 110051]
MQDVEECVASEGRRARKLREAKVATQRAGLELCAEHGYAAVTVEMIADRAGISPRTFYNYFPSREAALLGEAKPTPTEEAVEAFISRDDCSDVEAFALMMAQAWSASEPDRELFRLRRAVIDANPELAGVNLGRISESRAHYAAIVRRRLEARYPELDEAAIEVESSLTVAIAMSAIQAVAKDWMAGGAALDADLTALIHELFPRVRRLTQPADAS